MFGLAVGGLATPETEAEPEGRRVGDSACAPGASGLLVLSGDFSCTVSRTVVRGDAAPVVALRTSAGAGGTPKPVTSKSSFKDFFFTGAGSTAGSTSSIRIEGIGRSYSTCTV
jgi:hypothetical protein